MRSAIKTTPIGDSLHLSECHDGYWLYDDTRGINIAMRAETENAALIQALLYYQRHTLKIENRNKVLVNAVNSIDGILVNINED